MSSKKTRTVLFTCKGCGRQVRVANKSECHINELCYSCLDGVRSLEERRDVLHANKKGVWTNG